jgi:catechol 2,3-dioxygenase-like lactoylglutathione lyase family enzyme
MKIEHVAFNVPDPVNMARWYVDHLGFTVKRRSVDPPYGHFLADESGTVMIELYKNTSVPLPDYAAQPPQVLHLALVSRDAEADVRRLVAAGGTLVGSIDGAGTGDVLAFVRDPWGLCLQLAQRREAMIR